MQHVDQTDRKYVQEPSWTYTYDNGREAHKPPSQPA